MNAFNKLPGFVKSPAGAERTVLRRLPAALVIGTLLAALPSLAVRLYASHDAEADLLARIAIVDIYGICAVVLLWSALLTVGIGAFIVLVMKGPAYVADAYPLPDSDAPLP